MNLKNKYKKYEINEVMYYCDEFSYVVVIMRDDTIFRFEYLDDFIKWYKEMDVKNNARKNRTNDKRI